MDLARWRFAQGQGWEQHRHEFFELFWLERGSLRHRIDGGEEMLEAGHLRLVQPASEHFARAGAQGAMMVNLAVAGQALDDLRPHLGCDPWAGPPLHRLPAPAIAELSRLIAALDPELPADRDLLLMHIAHLLRSPAGRDPGVLPPRIDAALRQFAAEGAWREGLAGLARRAGLSREHLSRSVRATLGCTAGSLLGEMRLAAAARALLADDRPVSAVAAACGFVGLGHFYRRFRALYGVNPAAWRRGRGRRLVGADARAPEPGTAGEYVHR